jgi:hypothetical protein
MPGGPPELDLPPGGALRIPLSGPWLAGGLRPVPADAHRRSEDRNAAPAAIGLASHRRPTVATLSGLRGGSLHRLQGTLPRPLVPGSDEILHPVGLRGYRARAVPGTERTPASARHTSSNSTPAAWGIAYRARRSSHAIASRGCLASRSWCRSPEPVHEPRFERLSIASASSKGATSSVPRDQPDSFWRTS